MKPSAKEYAGAKDKGATARRAGSKPTDNPWYHASTEHGRILRDAWDDAYWQQDRAGVEAVSGFDLGTYHVRLVLANGDGFVMAFGTGPTYTHGRGSVHPLDATRIYPTWRSEDDLAGTIEYLFGEGNYSCDCNKRLFLADAHQQDRPDEVECGEELVIASLTLIRPDGTERMLEVRG